MPELLEDKNEKYVNVPYCAKIEPLWENCSHEVNPDPPESCLGPVLTVSNRIQCGKDVQGRMERKKLFDEGLWLLHPM